jgi:hypothetical protein
VPPGDWLASVVVDVAKGRIDRILDEGGVKRVSPRTYAL